MLNGWPWTFLAVLTLLAVGLGIYTLAAPKGLDLHGTVIENPPNMQDVTLLGVDGETRQLAEWEGRLVLIFFGYTHCPDTCPLTMAKLAQTYRDLGEPDDLQVLMVTVDPKRDTPEVMRSYVEGFHPDFVGLSGTPEMIAEASARFYVGSNQMPDSSVAHSSQVTLLDRQGRMRLIYNQDKLDGTLNEDLEALLAHKGAW